MLTPLVGREEEIDLLRRQWDHAKRGDGRVVSANFMNCHPLYAATMIAVIRHDAQRSSEVPSIVSGTRNCER